MLVFFVLLKSCVRFCEKTLAQQDFAGFLAALRNALAIEKNNHFPYEKSTFFRSFSVFAGGK